VCCVWVRQNIAAVQWENREKTHTEESQINTTARNLSAFRLCIWMSNVHLQFQVTEFSVFLFYLYKIAQLQKLEWNTA